jgi:hypothetical protein
VRDLIASCRKRFVDLSQDPSPADLEEFRIRVAFITRVAWFMIRDKLRIILRDQYELHDEGRVVWGALIQANQLLFDPANRTTLPAAGVYSPDRYYDDHVEDLQSIAQTLSELKGTKPKEPRLRRLVDLITDELARALRLQVPEEMCEGREVYLTTFLVQPSHLPDGYLAQGFFPLLIAPRTTAAVMVLPARYWPPELLQLWTEE